MLPLPTQPLSMLSATSAARIETVFHHLNLRLNCTPFIKEVYQSESQLLASSFPSGHSRSLTVTPSPALWPHHNNITPWAHYPPAMPFQSCRAAPRVGESYGPPSPSLLPPKSSLARPAGLARTQPAPPQHRVYVHGICRSKLWHHDVSGWVPACSSAAPRPRHQSWRPAGRSSGTDGVPRRRTAG